MESGRDHGRRAKDGHFACINMQTETYLGIAHESLMQTIVALRDLMSHHTVHIEGLQLRRYISLAQIHQRLSADSQNVP